MSDVIFKIISCDVQFFLFYYFLSAIGQAVQGTKYDTTKKIILIVSAAAMSLCGILLTGTFPINTLVLTLMVFSVLKFVQKFNMPKAIILSISIPIFLVLAEILSVSSFVLLTGISAPEMLKIPWLCCFINCFTALLLFLGILIFSRILVNKQIIKNYLQRWNANYLKLTMYILLFTFIPQAVLIMLNQYDYHPLSLLFNFISLSSVSVFLFWYISNYLEKEKIQEQLLTLEMDNRTLGGMVDGVRTIKHDFNNIFQAINGYLCSKQYDKLEEYVLKVMKECNIVNTLSIINKNTFDDPANYGVIGSKYFVATENSITMDLDVTVSFKNINFPMAELSRLFGILLDNAIEATSRCDNKYIRLEIKSVSKKNAIVIRVINTFDTSCKIDLGSIYNKGYSSKKIKSGLGLWEARRIISKCKQAQMYATIENDKFIQNIIIENA
jgi:two-component system sensor histidine kinase AgrC